MVFKVIFKSSFLFYPVKAYYYYNKAMTAKRVLYAVTKGNWGGAQRYVFDLANVAF